MKHRICNASPARMMFWASRIDDCDSAFTNHEAPEDCTCKHAKSPIRKILDSQLTLMGEYCSPPAALISRLRNIYTDAERKMGAIKMKTVWRMKSARLSSL